MISPPHAHTTHELQPVDLTFYGPLHYRHFITPNMTSGWKNHPRQRISQYDLGELFGNSAKASGWSYTTKQMKQGRSWTFNRWRTGVSGTWKYDDPRLKMSHEGVRTTVCHMFCRMTKMAAWEICLQDGGNATNPTETNTTNHGAYSSVVTYFYTRNSYRTFSHYHFIIPSDRFPVPVRSAVKSNLTAWCNQILSNHAYSQLLVFHHLLSFIPDLKSSFFANPFYCSLSFSSPGLTTWFHWLLLLLLSISVLVFLFYTF